MKRFAAILLFIMLSIACWAQPAYTKALDNLTFTFQPQFGNTLPVTTNLGILGVGAQVWSWKTNVIDLKYTVKPFSFAATKDTTVHGRLWNLFRTNATLGVDWGTGPTAGYYLGQPLATYRASLRQNTTVYFQYQVNGKQVREALHPVKVVAAITDDERIVFLQDDVARLNQQINILRDAIREMIDSGLTPSANSVQRESYIRLIHQ